MCTHVYVYITSHTHLMSKHCRFESDIINILHLPWIVSDLYKYVSNGNQYHYEPILLHHNWWHSSEISIQHHSWPPLAGMMLMPLWAILHHIWRHSSEIPIQHYSWPQVAGMSLMPLWDSITPSLKEEFTVFHSTSHLTLSLGYVFFRCQYTKGQSITVHVNEGQGTESL